MTAPARTDLDGFQLPDTTNVPDLPEFDTYYGVWLSPIGDEGDVVILGHAGKLRALAAIRAWLRYCEGANRACRADDPHAWARVNESLRGWDPSSQPVDDVDHRYAVVLTHCAEYPSCGTDPISAEAGRCWRCADIAGSAWWLDLDPTTDADTPGAFPVTYWPG
jgi:hypothetical protein